MSGAQTSTFPSENTLMQTLSGKLGTDVLAGQIANQQNQLMMPYRVQEAQQQVGGTEMEMMGRAAQGLLDPQQYPTLESRAAAYPGIVANLQRYGFAKNAPAEYPGDAQIQSVARMGIPSADQFRLQLSNNALNAVWPGGTPPAASGTPPASGQGSTPPAPTATGNFATDLAQAESGGKSNIINSSGYTGTYQFGKQRLADLGYYTPAPGENMADNTNWAGRVSIPGFNVTDQQSFANNPAAQQVAFNTHLGNIDQAIDNTPGAANLDRNGLRAVAHLGGIDGMQKFVASGGAYNPADANGTRLSAYYQRFSGGGAPGSAAPSGTTAVAASTPGGGKAVVIGDSLASPGGLGGSGVVGAQPGAIRAEIADGASKGAYTGKDVVLSSGASNAPGDMANVEAQLKLLRDAGSVTLLGVGPGVEAKNPGTNANLARLAAQYGARFQPLPTDQMSPDGVHPTGAGYATLKTAVAPPGAAPQQQGRYQVASNAPVPPPGPTAPPAAPTVAQNALAPPASAFGPGAFGTPPPAQPPAAPSANQLMPGQPNGPPAPQPPSAQPPAAAPTPAPGSMQPPAPPVVRQPAAVPLPPAPPPTDARGLTAQDYQDLSRMRAGLVGQPNGAQLLQAEIDRRTQLNYTRQQNYLAAQEKQRADDIAAQQLGLTGANTALEYWKANPDYQGAVKRAQETNSNVEVRGVGNFMVTPQGRIFIPQPYQGDVIGPGGAKTPAFFYPPPPGSPPGTPATGAPVVIGGGPGGGPQLATSTLSPEAEAESKAYGEQSKGIIDAGAKAPVSMQRVDVLQNAADQFRPGSTAAMRLAGGKLAVDALQSFGISPPQWLANGAAAGETIGKEGGYLAAEMTRALGSREAASVFSQIKNIQPNIEMSQGGFQVILNSIRQGLQRDQDLATYRESWLADPTHNGSIRGMTDAFEKAAPVEAYASRVVPYPMPTSQNAAIPNVIYNTSKGPARWNGTAFEPVSPQSAAPATSQPPPSGSPSNATVPQFGALP